MLCAMEIYGKLYEGKSFSEIERGLYYDFPQLAEDEPMYAVMLDLRYRYHIEKGETERAADSLNRLASASSYLSEEEFSQTAAELVYMHSLVGDKARAEESGKTCRALFAGRDAFGVQNFGRVCRVLRRWRKGKNFEGTGRASPFGRTLRRAQTF